MTTESMEYSVWGFYWYKPQVINDLPFQTQMPGEQRDHNIFWKLTYSNFYLKQYSHDNNFTMEVAAQLLNEWTCC
jgi:hypothetical protein